MNHIAQNICNRLSMRQPLRDALEIISTLTDQLELKKEVDLEAELEKVKSHFPSCTDFERTFPSLCFSIATGIGKTRLMGATIAYLHLKKGIRNFFVLAPNLTIYDKLIEDFGNPSSAKYVFNGISEFVHNRPIVITGDNYAQQGGLFRENEVRINVFNIAKFNSDNRATRSGGVSKPPRLKRLAEYLGMSYWEYLAGLDDLVILMDEAHRYHADASRKAVNELNPVLGIELTATPIDENGVAFKNIVFEYTLAKALEDGKYVKNPSIATRKNFDPKGLKDQEIEMIKLEDSMSIHEDTRQELELYALNNQVKKVKPFVLVVCRTIEHARDTAAYMASSEFFRGEYAGKILQIDSSSNDDENAKLLSTVENPDNPIEIVIHVNMLAEGWDVTNLYTICPLRKADSIKLVEQTIGRGLRLPYGGERTHVDKIDKLTVLAHDNFTQVINAAKEPGSILQKFSYVEIEKDQLTERTVVITSSSKVNIQIRQEAESIAKIANEVEKQKVTVSFDAKRTLLEAIKDIEIIQSSGGLNNYDSPEVKTKVIEKATKLIEIGQQDIFKDSIVAELPNVYEKTLVQFRNAIIEIPRISLVPGEPKVWFDDFDLDTTNGFDMRILAEEIIRQGLVDNDIDIIGVKQGAFKKNTPVSELIAEVVDHPEVDYDSNADLLNKICGQAIAKLESTLEDKSQLPLLVRQYRRLLGARIYEQLQAHFHIDEGEIQVKSVAAFMPILDHNYSKLQNNGYRDYRENITPISSIPKYVYRGFEKALHMEYKFDSKTEKDFAVVLENDTNVLKWLRPADKQFNISYNNHSSLYRPDFIVETNEGIYMVETKAGNEVNSPEVLDKAKFARRYCQQASEYTATIGGKPWKYILIPHDEVVVTRSWGWYLSFV